MYLSSSSSNFLKFLLTDYSFVLISCPYKFVFSLPRYFSVLFHPISTCLPLFPFSIDVTYHFYLFSSSALLCFFSFPFFLFRVPHLLLPPFTELFIFYIILINRFSCPLPIFFSLEKSNRLLHHQFPLFHYN